MADKAKIVENVIDKLYNLPLNLELDMTGEHLENPIYDTMREMGISDISNITVGSKQELYFEIRVEWYALRKIRNEVATYFKWSSGSDGKEVDKEEIFKAIDKIMKDLDTQFSIWNSKSNNSRRASGILTLKTRETSRLS